MAEGGTPISGISLAFLLQGLSKDDDSLYRCLTRKQGCACQQLMTHALMSRVLVCGGEEGMSASSDNLLSRPGTKQSLL